MSTLKTIDFKDLGSNGFRDIPSPYQGFNWIGYSVSERFEGPVRVELDEVRGGVIYGTGLQISAERGGCFFNVDSLKLYSSANGAIDVTIKAYRTTSGVAELITSFLVRSLATPSDSFNSNPIIAELNIKNIDVLEIYSNAMEVFHVHDIAVSDGQSSPLSPVVHF